MSVTDVILVTAASTLVAAAAIYFAAKGMRAAWRVLKSLPYSFLELKKSVDRAADILAAVHSELAYIQAISPGQAAEQAPVPPVGRAGTMPTEFPQRPWETYPDAKLEETDMKSINETDEDVMVAQLREEMRAKGIEPDDDSPQPAVVEQA